MKAAIIRGAGQAPVYGEISEPVVGAGEVAVQVTAAALSHVTRSRAAGTHYSADGTATVPGIDGVGRLENGQRVYFFMPGAPGGSMAERATVEVRRCLPVPDEVDDATAAAIAIPGVSSWAAFIGRAGLQRGETVLINGATGASGRLAVQIAKHLGAGKVIATGRDAKSLTALEALGADSVIQLTDDASALGPQLEQAFAAGVDIVVDYLWGRPAEAVLVAAARAGQDGRPLRYVEIGSAAGPDITLPSAVLRSSSITLMGSGLGSVPPRLLGESLTALFGAVKPAGLAVATRVVPLAEIERLWGAQTGSERLVFVPEAP